MRQTTEALVWMRHWQWHVQGWFACYVAPPRCALFLVGRSMKLGIMAGMPEGQLCACSGTYKAGIAGDNAPRAVFSTLVRRRMMLCIMSVLVQKDFFSSSTSLSCCRGRSSCPGLFCRSQSFPSCCDVSGCRCPCCAGRVGSLPCRDAEAGSHGQACWRTIDISQLQYAPGG